MVSFTIATGSFFFASSSVIAQSSTSGENTNNSSRVLNKIKNENILNWGYSNGNFPVSHENNSLAEPAGLCAKLMGLLENYLNTNGLVNNGFEIKPYSVRFEDRFENTKIQESRPPKFDIECGANTIREDVQGLIFSRRFAKSRTKILIPNSKERLFKNVLDLETNDSVNLGIIENSTSENKISAFLPDNHSIKNFKTKGEAIEALEDGKIDGFVNDEILLTSILKQDAISDSEDYIIYKGKYKGKLGLEPYGLVLPGDDRIWKDTINKFIRENQKELDKLQKEYIDDYITPAPSEYSNPKPENKVQGEGEENKPEILEPKGSDVIESSDSKIPWQVFLGLLLLGLGLGLGLGFVGIYWIKLRKGQKKSFEHGYALLIGVGRCANSKLSLPVTVKDVQEIRKTLVNPKFCAYSDDEDHIRLLHDELATRKNILDGLNWLKQQAEHDPNATVTVYYSGHGVRRKSDNCYYLIQHDTDTNYFEETALSAENFNEKLRQIKAKRLLVVIDSCHAAGMATSKDKLEKQEPVPLFSRILSDFEEKAYPKISVDDRNNGEGIVVFTSSKGSESSWIHPSKEMSIYTYHLIEALKGKGNIKSDKSIKVSHLMNYLAKKVPESAKKLCKAEQTPNFDFNTEDFTIALLKKKES
ncbi:MAG: caspase family protein [Cyanobacteria bacterium P01_A01_bin.45]